MEERTKEQEISASLSRLFRDSFGKGPESLYVTIRGTFITIYLRNFMTPSEQILLAQGQEITIQQTRDALMNTLIPEIRALIKIVTNMDIREIYYDWSLQNRSGCIVGISSQPYEFGHELREDFNGKDTFDAEIRAISQQAQKVPEELYSCMLTQRNLLVVRNGILVSIEKELIRMGFHETLKIAKRHLEKQYLHNDFRWEQILNTKVIDIFADWDFVRDKSVMLFILNPTN